VGLDLRLHLQTPDTARWSYSGFGRFRARVCRDAGLGEIDSYVGFGGTKSWPDSGDEPLAPLLNHSDYDGELWGWQLHGAGTRLRAIVEAWSDNFPDGYDRGMGLRLAAMLEQAEAQGGVVEFS
jgi:hypothetical protein